MFQFSGVAFSITFFSNLFNNFLAILICFGSNFIYHDIGCFERRCEGWFINGVVICSYCHLLLGGESLNKVLEKHERWKNALERKGLMVNVDKTKSVQLLFGKKSCVSKMDPCSACGEQVGCNSVQCTKH